MTSVSAAAQSYAKRAFGVDSVILPNVIDVKSFTRDQVKNQPGRIVFLGRLVKRKGCAQLIKALAEVKKVYPGVQLVIAGDGPDRQKLERLVKKLGLGANVQFKGFVSEQEKPNILASAAIACFPSLYGESFGIVLIEAMAAGAGVVIGGNNPGYKGVLDFEPKTIFDPKNVHELSTLLKQLLKDPKLSKRIHLSQQQAVKEYDIDYIGRHWLKIYHGEQL